MAKDKRRTPAPRATVVSYGVSIALGSLPKIPVKIIFPVIFCILPSLFVVVMGPGIIRFLETF